MVFATEGREIKVREKVREERRYITGIFANKEQQMIAIYLNTDPIHIFLSYKNLSMSIPDLVKLIKVESINVINERKIVFGKFGWK